MRLFGSVRIPGFGRLAPRIGAIATPRRRSAGPRETSSVWFWIGFLGMLALAWYVVEQVKR